MKKIGIITYHFVCNFGAQLQAISTVGYLKRKGYNPVIIHWYPKDLDELFQKRIPPEQCKCHIDFAEQNMPLTKLCRTENELLQIIEENNFDAIILGSDALFKYLPVNERKVFSKQKFRIVDNHFASDQILEGNPFWGSFIPKLKKRIPVGVFSVSSQNAQYTKVNKQEYEELKRSLERFKYITVRDEWTKKMVQYFLGNLDVPVTPDPVFSFNQNSYLPFQNKKDIMQKFNLPEKYVLLSFNNRRITTNFVKKIETELVINGYTPVAFPHPEGLKDFGIESKIRLPLSPLDWYYLIKYSDGYIGERMHPIIVALHNAVPFFCFDHYGAFEKRILYIRKFGKFIQESSKIYHILSKADLLNNMLFLNKDRFGIVYAMQGLLPGKIATKNIIENFLSFNKQQALEFSRKQQLSYENSMDNLLGQLLK